LIFKIFSVYHYTGKISRIRSTDSRIMHGSREEHLSYELTQDSKHMFSFFCVSFFYTKQTGSSSVYHTILTRAQRKTEVTRDPAKAQRGCLLSVISPLIPIV